MDELSQIVSNMDTLSAIAGFAMMAFFVAMIWMDSKDN